VHDGAVLDERPPGVEGDDAAGAALVVLVLAKVCSSVNHFHHG